MAAMHDSQVEQGNMHGCMPGQDARGVQEDAAAQTAVAGNRKHPTHEENNNTRGMQHTQKCSRVQQTI